jgi:hypothetical protein
LKSFTIGKIYLNFLSKDAGFLCLGLFKAKGFQDTGKASSPPKENIQLFKT